MKFLILCTLVAVALARPEYHDDVFHFSSLQGLESLRGLSKGSQEVTVQKIAQPLQQVTFQKIAQPVQEVTIQRIAQPVQQVTIQRIAQPVQQVTTFQKIAQPVQQVTYQNVAQPLLSQTSVYSQQSSQSLTADGRARILQHLQEVDPLGYYKVSFQTENGISFNEQGTLTNPGSADEGIAKEGSYSYTGPDGVVYTVTYTADENGFQAAGEHLPTPPPIPAEILRALEINAAEGDKYDDQGNLRG